ncbi:hypothetical protein GXW82_38200 [Streptacidiphilus sp. 4-A2]|nr:hypothetical protein [Streptacidiphilus sp. 4-A2]
MAGVVAALAALLSGCGIRDTSLPVDAGQGASRTACPPSPGASLSQLDRDAYAAQSTGAPGWPVPEATGPRAVRARPPRPPPRPRSPGRSPACNRAVPAAAAVPAARPAHQRRGHRLPLIRRAPAPAIPPPVIPRL